MNEIQKRIIDSIAKDEETIFNPFGGGFSVHVTAIGMVGGLMVGKTLEYGVITSYDNIFTTFEIDGYKCTSHTRYLNNRLIG